MTRLIGLAILMTLTLAATLTAQVLKLATPEEQRMLLAAQADSPYTVNADGIEWAVNHAVSVTLLHYTPESGIVITRKMDPQTVLCIEHQEAPTVRWSNSPFLVPATTDTIQGTNVGANTVTVPEAPKLLERTCQTVAAWLTDSAR